MDVADDPIEANAAKRGVDRVLRGQLLLRDSEVTGQVIHLLTNGDLGWKLNPQHLRERVGRWK